MNSNNQFYLNLPGEWEDLTVHYFKGPEDSGVQHALTLVVDPHTEGATLEQYARERVDSALNILQGVEILKDEEVTLADNRPAYECVYKWIPADDKIVFRKLVFLMIDGTAYTFSSDFSKKTLKTIGVEVDRIIASFTPGVPQAG